MDPASATPNTPGAVFNYAIPTQPRESARIRNANAAQAEAEYSNNTVAVDVVKLNTIISAAMQDANTTFLKSSTLTKTLAGVVKEKLFEGAALDASKKLPVNKAQLKKIVSDNGITVHGIITDALKPQLAKATKVGQHTRFTTYCVLST